MPVAEYPKLHSSELRLWLSNLRQAVMGAFKRVKNMYAQGCGVRNMLGITRLGFKMLRESEICDIPCDKEGLFCTVPTQFFFCYTRGFLKLLDITKRLIQRSPMSCLHSRDTDPCQGAFQSLISLPKPAWLLHRSWCGDRRFYRTSSLTSRATNQMVRLEFETFMQVQMNKREGLS